MPDLSQYKGKRIIYIVCESTELNDSYALAADQATDIWTCSKFCQTILQEKLNRDVAVVPHYTTRYLYAPSKRLKPVILLSFDAHSRIMRKNPIDSLYAIRKAFGDQCKVNIKTKNLLPSYSGWILEEFSDLNISIINESVSVETMSKLYSTSDIFLSLHRGEGFGMQLLEAMAHGCKVVATNYGGCLEFLNDSNSYLATYREVDCEDKFFKGRWAKPNIDHAAQLLQEAQADNFIKCKRGFATALDFNFTNTAKSILNLL